MKLSSFATNLGQDLIIEFSFLYVNLCVWVGGGVGVSLLRAMKAN